MYVNRGIARRFDLESIVILAISGYYHRKRIGTLLMDVKTDLVDAVVKIGHSSPAIALNSIRIRQIRINGAPGK